MGGIAGYRSLSANDALLQRVSYCQQHGEPDGEGDFVDGPCGLAHRWLSIIDVAHGKQPMVTADGQYTISYKGEIYDYLDLRAELERVGCTFRTTTRPRPSTGSASSRRVRMRLQSAHQDLDPHHQRGARRQPGRPRPCEQAAGHDRVAVSHRL